jgi:hypothetical protein
MTDIIIGSQKIAPLVKRGNAAKVIGNLGQRIQTVEPPSIRMKKFLTPGDLFYTRGAGAPVFVPGGAAGADPILQARKNRIAREQYDLRAIGDRTIEYLACQGLGGSYSIAQDDGTYSIDFSMPAANKPVITTTADKWITPATCTPFANIRAWKLIAKKATGRIPSLVVCNSTTFEYFLASTEVQNYLNKLKMNMGTFETEKTIQQSGAEYKGTVDGMKYYTYDGIYLDKNGDAQQMIPDGYVSLICTDADYRLQFGGIEDLEAGTAVAEYFSKDWVEHDPSGLYLLVETHPLPTFNQPAANIYAKVA